MQCARSVSVALGHISHVLESLLAQLSLVWIFTGAEELCADPCQHLKFSICSSRAAGRNCEFARSEFVVKAVEHRCRIAVDLNIGIVLRNGK